MGMAQASGGWTETKIKICGLKRPEDIRYVNRARPDFAGFIIGFPKSHRNLEPEAVRELAGGLDPGITPVGVFVDAPEDLICGLLRDGTIGMAQLHGHETEEMTESIRRKTGRPVIKAFRVRTEEDIRQALQSPADYILLDQGQGSGRTFDWNLVPPIARPWFLAGGLDAANLPEAIARLHPWAVDLSSSVEIDRKKDGALICQAVETVRRAYGK